MITISTTHYGSDLCRVLTAYHNTPGIDWRAWALVFGSHWNQGVFTGGFRDQIPGSDGLRRIGKTRIPSHAIACTAEDKDLGLIDNGYYQARVLEDVYEVPPVRVREGLSLPILPLFKDILAAETVLLGFCDPQCNAHSFDEFFDGADLLRGAKTAARFIAEMASANPLSC